MVLAPEHPLVERLTKSGERRDVSAYREQTKKRDIITRKTSIEKTGVFTGSYAINPATEKEIPIWISDYVLMEYGTGAIMGVPGHDQRDFEFAKKFDLPIVRVVCGEREDVNTPLHEAFTECESGTLVNSGVFDGFRVENAKKAIVEFLTKAGSAKPVVHYRLHDWCISRQRYWGPPIPIIYCESCGTVPVPEKDLPVVLPFIEDFKPDDSGVSPLARHKEWYLVECPKCGKTGRRETDVSDTFLDSAWYFLRYPSVGRDDVPFEKNVTMKWLPVTSYIGGNEHAVMRKLHQTIRKVSEDIPRLSYNTAIAAMMEYMNVLRKGERTPHRDEVFPLITLVSPFAPHIAEELWEQTGETGSVFDSAWPSFDPALAAEDLIELVVQVNGKVRGRVMVAPDTTEKAALVAALADPAVSKFVASAPRKVVFVPGRLLNIVV